MSEGARRIFSEDAPSSELLDDAQRGFKILEDPSRCANDYHS